MAAENDSNHLENLIDLYLNNVEKRARNWMDGTNLGRVEIVIDTYPSLWVELSTGERGEQWIIDSNQSGSTLLYKRSRADAKEAILKFMQANHLRKEQNSDG